MSDPLDAVRTIADQRRALEVAYREALQAARDAGHPASRIGQAAGTTRQNVLKLTVAPATPVVDELAPLVARLAELDARWELFVDRLAQAYFVDPDAKREQLRRNTENGKRKRVEARAVKSVAARGLRPSVTLNIIPTVASDGRRAAETYALRYLDEHRAHPVVDQVVRELDEAAALRETISTRTDPVWLHD